MRHKGMTQSGIEAALREENRLRCSPPLLDNEVHQIAQSICRYEPAPQPLHEMHYTDLGNAQFLMDTYDNIFHYCKTFTKWFIWTGSNWQIDTTGKIKEYAIDSVKKIRQQGMATTDPELGKHLISHAIKSESNARINAMVQLSEGLPAVAISPEDLDQNGMLLNCENGIIDLKTGKLLPHKKEYLLTKTAITQYDESAKCPMWEQFLSDIMLDRPELINFLQRMAGYSITSNMEEQCFFILYGKGENGKTTFVETIQKILNDYATVASADTLLVKRGDAVPNDLAILRGSRLASVSETGSGRHLNEALVKQITGGGQISARFLYGEYFVFNPTFKIWIDTNHKPSIKGTDHAIWRRVRLIPFEFQVDPLLRDNDLGQKLLQEKEGILNWLIQGCLKWQKEGLQIPQEIANATAAYQEDEDVLGDFINEYCDVDENAKILFKELYQTYLEYCKENNQEAYSITKFGKMLQEREYQKIRQTTGDKSIMYKGLRLKTSTKELF
jgi:putative DNA primase/helicase